MLDRETYVNLTKGEVKVLKILIKRGPSTWSELLEHTGLSKAGLYKILKRLKNAGIIEETLVYRGDRVYKGYKSRYRNLQDASFVMFNHKIFDEIKRIVTMEKITRIEIYELFENILEYINFLSVYSFYKIFLYERPRYKDVFENLSKQLEILAREMKKDQRLAKAIRDNIDLLIDFI